MSKNKKPWAGRFKSDTHPEMEKFGESLSFDKRLAPADVKASIAHARMLGKQRIITKKDSETIVRGLRQIEKEIRDGKFKYRPQLEDIHMNIERRLTEIVGQVGGKLHTGRSRNDQVATDLRLWLREEIDSCLKEISELIEAFAMQADKHAETPMPGYTHLQRAQPVTFGHHMLAYAGMFERDSQRLAECRKRTNVLPLGAGALAASTLPLDTGYVAQLLGFDGVFENSMDAVSDRDFAVEFISHAALCQVHLSRLAEELIMWSSTEFGFVELPENFTTGSSLMPQKRNPDSAELIRAKTGRIAGDLTALLTALKGLPLTYNKDMQEDKEPLFDAADTLRASLRVATHLVKGMKVNKAAMARALEDGYLQATDVAEYLVRKGMPFREAHEVVGKIVGLASDKKLKLKELPLSEYKRMSKLFGEDIYECLDPVKSVTLRKAGGGPGTAKSQARKLKRRKKK